MVSRIAISQIICFIGTISSSYFFFFSREGELNLLEDPSSTATSLKRFTILQFTINFILYGVLSTFFAGYLTVSTILQNGIQAIASFIIGTLIFHSLAVLFGAPFLVTNNWSMFMATLVFVPIACSRDYNLKYWWKLPELQINKLSLIELSLIVPSFFAILGTWIGAFPIPLDWDRAWQVWPISCTYGGLIGYVIGLCLSIIVIEFRNNLKKDDKLQ